MSTIGGAGPVQPHLASFLPDWLNPQVFLADPALAPWVVLLVCGIIFAETGLLVGFFLPGDSMLFTAGLLVATGHHQVQHLGVLGADHRRGHHRQPDRLPDRLQGWSGDLQQARFPALQARERRSAHAFFEKHGGKALILARFVPIIRTFVPVIVGVAQMDKRKFFLFNVIGALLWGGGVTLLGYLLGDKVPWVRENLDIIFIVIVLLSVIPIGIEVARGLHRQAPGREVRHGRRGRVHRGTRARRRPQDPLGARRARRAPAPTPPGSG